FGPPMWGLLAVVGAGPCLGFFALGLAAPPFPFRCVQLDVREPPALPRFDTVVTDPPYTVAGARLFVTRAAEVLRGEGSSVFLSFGSRRPGVQLELQRAILEAGPATRPPAPAF